MIETVAAVADTPDQLLLFVVELAEPVVAEQLQTHQDRRDRGLHLMRDGRDEVGLGRIQFLVFGDVAQDNQVADELLFASADRCDVERRILHLEVALLVVGVDFQRLSSGRSLFSVKLAHQTAQQVVGEGDLGGVAADDLRLQIQHRERFAVHEEDLAVGAETDDRLVERIDDRFDAFLGRHQVVERTAAVFVELGRHVVERFGYGFEFTVAREVEPLLVVVVGDFADALFQFVDGTQHQPRKPYQNGAGTDDAERRHDDQPPHHVVGAFLDGKTFGADGRHVEFHNAQQVLAHRLQFGLGDGVAQRRDMAAELRCHLPFADLGDVLLLEGETLPQGVPRNGIFADVVERTQHVGGVLQRVVIVGQNGSRGARKLPHVADRLDAEQHDHGEKNADAQCEPSLYFHGYDNIYRSMFMRDSLPMRRRIPTTFFNSENSENSGRPTQTILIFCSRQISTIVSTGRLECTCRI